MSERQGVLGCVLDFSVAPRGHDNVAEDDTLVGDRCQAVEVVQGRDARAGTRDLQGGGGHQGSRGGRGGQELNS